MKVLFLDIDGCLNSHISNRKYGSFNILIPEALAHIQSIASKGVKIVVSSTWRKGRTIDELSVILGCEIYDKTPVFNTNTTRGEEINSWLISLIYAEPDENISYCIIDDDSDMLEYQKPFFVKTDMKVGMTDQDYRKVCKLLDISEI